MSAILVYSPCPIFAGAFGEVMEYEFLHAQSSAELAAHLQNPASAPVILLLIDASHTIEDGKTPAYLADMPQLPENLPVILLVNGETDREYIKISSDVALILPLRLQELKERINSVITPDNISITPAVSFYPSRREISCNNGEVIVLTEKESDILRYMLQDRTVSHSRESLLKSLWGYADNINSRTLETHIYRLRGKLEALDEAGITIISTNGGYRVGEKPDSC